ncbi:unnamed protein product [Moneuplotes crassus]|uniref:Uncharacterized protein n=1 Tax=Euplotes crassus TaxID=5936 RepID=A0AAD1UKT7_EUPCR|nr:unnamed protein product [Moneuplotes crassus]
MNNSPKAQPITKKLYLKSLSKISQLEESIKIHKNTIESLVVQIDDLKQQDKDNNLILQKLIDQNKNEYFIEKRELVAKINSLRDLLEHKECQFQEKELKWARVDALITEHARGDPSLLEALNEAQYLCDNFVTNRKISTVITENERLKSQVEEMRSEIAEMRTNLTLLDFADNKETENIFIEEPVKLTHKSSKIIHYHDNILHEENSEKFSNRPKLPTKSVGVKNPKGYFPKSTKEISENIKLRKGSHQNGRHLAIPKAPYAHESSRGLDSVTESSIRVAILEDQSPQDSLSSIDGSNSPRGNEFSDEINECLQGFS